MQIQTTRIISIFCAVKGCFQALLFFFLCCFLAAAPAAASPGNFTLDFTTIRLGDDAPELTQAIPAIVRADGSDTATASADAARDRVAVEADS